MPKRVSEAGSGVLLRAGVRLTWSKKACADSGPYAGEPPMVRNHVSVEGSVDPLPDVDPGYWMRNPKKLGCRCRAAWSTTKYPVPADKVTGHDVLGACQTGAEQLLHTRLTPRGGNRPFDHRRSKSSPHCGQIWRVRLDPVVGSEQAGERTALVIYLG
jgi:hypothetical protein